MRGAVATGIAAMISIAGGCASIGTASIRPDRFHYNEAGAESSKEQLLLNLVRLRYGEPIYFLDIGSMLSQRTIGGTANLSGWHNDLHGAFGPALRAAYGIEGDATRQTTAGLNLNYSDEPTITYSPVQGEKFSQQFMTPISPMTLGYLAQSGWSLDRIMECCVQRINDLQNLPVNDSDHDTAPGFARLRRAAALMKVLQDTHQMQVTVETADKAPGMFIRFGDKSSEQPEARELCELLGVGAGAVGASIHVVLAPAAPQTGEISIQSRSLFAVMYAMAQQIPVPDEHAKRHEVGRVPAAATEAAAEERWLAIGHSRTPQLDPFVQIYYNGYWYYISRDDWSSKRTFSLLTYLLSLQASTQRGMEPFLTVPAAR